MVSTLASFGALYAAALTFVMGIGVLNTHLSLTMTQAGFADHVTGIIMACYFLGAFCGYFVCYHIISRVGHIRAFAAFAALSTVVIILYGIHLSPWTWAILRFLNGINTFGLFMVIESWLNASADSQSRGRVFSVYMVVAYTAFGTGQQFLNLGGAHGEHLLSIAAILICMSLVPVVVTRSVHPELPAPERYRLPTLFRKAPLGMLGCLCAGLGNSAFFSMAPVFGIKIGLTVFQLSWFMSATIFGGLMLQWTVGVVSDRFDRTLVIITISVLIGIYTLLLGLYPVDAYPMLLVAMAVLGGFLFALYPVAVARAHDVFTPKDTVAVSSALLLCFNIGAVFGPIAASLLMSVLETPYGLFFFWAATNAVFTMAFVYLRFKETVPIIAAADQVDFVPMKSTSAVAMVMDPRAEYPDTETSVQQSEHPTGGLILKPDSANG